MSMEATESVMSKREKPSTRARREGYAQLHKLRRLLTRLLYAGKFSLDEETDSGSFSAEFNKEGWRDYMVKYIPELRRGGDPTIKVTSKRRKRREKERKATIR